MDSKELNIEAISPEFCKSCTSEQLYLVLSAANSNLLKACLENPAITELHIISLLRNPFINQEIVRLVCTNRQWISKYRIKVSVVHCPKAPYILSIEFVNFLFWRDLVAVAKDVKIDPRLRVAAERLIMEKMVELSLGEKIALSRIATPHLVKTLIKERNSKIIRELLINPFIIEDDIVRIVNTVKDTAILIEIANAGKWRFRYNIKRALVVNSITPLSISLNLLPTLLKRDLVAVSKQYNLNPLLRREAEGILHQKRS